MYKCKKCDDFHSWMICNNCYEKLQVKYKQLQEDYLKLAKTSLGMFYYEKYEMWDEFFEEENVFYSLTQKYTIPLNIAPSRLLEELGMDIVEFAHQEAFKEE